MRPGPHARALFALVKSGREAFNRLGVSFPQQAGRRRARREERERQARRARVGCCDQRRVGVFRRARRVRVRRGRRIGGGARRADPAPAGRRHRARRCIARRPGPPGAASTCRNAARRALPRRLRGRRLRGFLGRRPGLRGACRDLLDADPADAPGPAPVVDCDAGRAGRGERCHVHRRERRNAGRAAGCGPARRVGECRHGLLRRGGGPGRRRLPRLPRAR